MAHGVLSSACFLVFGFSSPVVELEVSCVVQLEKVSSRRVAINQHATLPQMHQPTMMFSALPHDAAVAPPGMCSPARASTPGATPTALAGARNSKSASDQQGSPALSEAAAPTASTAVKDSHVQGGC